MTKQDIVSEISGKTEFTKDSVDKVLTELPLVLHKALNTEGRVILPGVCILKAKYYPKRKMKNYITEGTKDFEIAERMKVTAKAAASLSTGLKMNKKRK